MAAADKIPSSMGKNYHRRDCASIRVAARDLSREQVTETTADD
jgi:hypothetical protein